jgi:hypothetical protein
MKQNCLFCRSRANRDEALGGTENSGRRRFVPDGDFLENNAVLNPIEDVKSGVF